MSLAHDGTALDEDSIVGDECHIISGSQNGPRFISNVLDNLDNYNNLILLCKTHHKIVDDQPHTYTTELLREMKKKHVKWVQETLSHANLSQTKTNRILVRITGGRELLNIIKNGNHAYDFNHDELKDEIEVDIIGRFLQDLQDYGDLMSDMESVDQVRTSFVLAKQIQELERIGLWVFGANDTVNYKIHETSVKLSCTRIRIARADNPEIVEINMSVNK